MIHGHGGNIVKAAEILGCRPEEITDMSSNINPLGPMPGLLEHLKENIEKICRLPDPDAQHAANAYADLHGLSEKCVIAGSGTTEILYLLPRALGIRTALVAGPTYADYADALKINSAECTFFMRRADNRFCPDPEKLAKAAKGLDAVFFCNPNNPTGEFTDPEVLAGLASCLPDTYFIIDESYLPFVHGTAGKSIADPDLPNAVVLRSLSKMHCIPGLRVGFCLAPQALAEKIRIHIPPWSVNAQAQEAVSYISENSEAAKEHAGKTRQFLQQERKAFYKRLSDIAGLSVFQSDASFVLMRAQNFTAAEISRHMLENRILIRDCSNFYGLDEHYFRISLKDPETNRLAAGIIAEYSGQRAEGR
ncbi:MAG: threonine-phosphate decarboxylase [Desulfosalsimonas sp.]